MADAQSGSLGKRLRQERELRHWTQEELAENIGRSVPSINRWEHDRAEPQLDALKELTALFGKPPDRWGMSRWNVPFLRNPYFTGREQLLLSLHRTLAADKTVTVSQSRAISGLGGIGKTQIAIEYAYRYAREYQAVLWVSADPHELLVSEFARLAQTLDLPGKEEQDQWRIVSAVKRWLQEHSGWLLILDNADDLQHRRLSASWGKRGDAGDDALPGHRENRQESLSGKDGDVRGYPVLLRRATLLAEEEPLETVSAATRTAARQLVEELDGLPLALDQAGAYIEETGCSLSEYVALYTAAPLGAAQTGRAARASDYPYTVASTWTLSFSQVEQADPAAADLLRLCAFLHPDAIPEEI